MASGGFDKNLLSILVCPKTKTPLIYDEKHQRLISEKAGLAYPIEEGIPVLLIEAGKPIH